MFIIQIKKIKRKIFKIAKNYQFNKTVAREVPKKYQDLAIKIQRSSPIWGSHQTIEFPDGFILKGGREKERLFFEDLPKELSKDSILDIGCNIGANCIECKKRDAKKVVGLDYDENLIACAQEIAGIFDFDIRYDVFDISSSEIKEKFDYVFFLNVFHHLNEKSKIRSLRILDEITIKKMYFEAPVPNDIVANNNRTLLLEDYFSYLKGFTTFKECKLLGYTDFKRPLIVCTR
jgi:2-polyprenyl-3-methyl-5-hydroxy-6-metoxy-1,4-benzoquinol methylase